jgi:hypothetical protein
MVIQMADTLQYGSITGNATMRQRISGEVGVGRKTPKELRFLPRSEFPQEGLEGVLYIDTDESVEYWWDGEHYVQMSGSGEGAQIDDEGIYTTKTWSSSKINSELKEDQTQIDNLAYEKITNLEIDAILNA